MTQPRHPAQSGAASRREIVGLIAGTVGLAASVVAAGSLVAFALFVRTPLDTPAPWGLWLFSRTPLVPLVLVAPTLAYLLVARLLSRRAELMSIVGGFLLWAAGLTSFVVVFFVPTS